MKTINTKLTYQELMVLVQSTEQLAEKENNPVVKVIICELNTKLNNYIRNFQIKNHGATINKGLKLNATQTTTINKNSNR